MALTLLDIYNKVTGQPWSIFDSQISQEDEIESNVLSAIQKAVRVIWDAYPYSFKLKNLTINTQSGVKAYDLPTGIIIKEGIWRISNETEPIEIKVKTKTQGLDSKTGTPEEFYVKYNKLNFYPIPDAEYEVSIDYNTLYLAIDSTGNSKANLAEFTDKLDIPVMYEDLFLTTLMNKAMVNAIASDNNKNYQPYLKQFIESYNSLLKSASGLETDTVVTW